MQCGVHGKNVAGRKLPYCMMYSSSAGNGTKTYSLCSQFACMSDTRTRCLHLLGKVMLTLFAMLPLCSLPTFSTFAHRITSRTTRTRGKRIHLWRNKRRWGRGWCMVRRAQLLQPCTNHVHLPMLHQGKARQTWGSSINGQGNSEKHGSRFSSRSMTRVVETKRGTISPLPTPFPLFYRESRSYESCKLLLVVSRFIPTRPPLSGSPSLCVKICTIKQTLESDCK